ncbi:hypothetical protein [Paenibacillus mucilaginosus]
MGKELQESNLRPDPKSGLPSLAIEGTLPGASPDLLGYGQCGIGIHEDQE